MRKHSMPEMKEGGVNVTPLIDIVMCLIIFFMLVAKIGVDSGGDKTISVPASFLGKDIKDLGNTLTLNISNGPSFGTDPQPTVTCLLKGEKQELKVRSDNGGATIFPMYDTLKYFKDGDPRTGVPANPDFKVIIRADENTEYRFIQPVLTECTRAKVDYDFATQKGQAPPG